MPYFSAFPFLQHLSLTACFITYFLVSSFSLSLSIQKSLSPPITYSLSPYVIFPILPFLYSALLSLYHFLLFLILPFSPRPSRVAPSVSLSCPPYPALLSLHHHASLPVSLSSLLYPLFRPFTVPASPHSLRSPLLPASPYLKSPRGTRHGVHSSRPKPEP